MNGEVSTVDGDLDVISPPKSKAAEDADGSEIFEALSGVSGELSSESDGSCLVGVCCSVLTAAFYAAVSWATTLVPVLTSGSS